MKNGAIDRRRETAKRSLLRDSVAAWANQAGVNVMAAEGLHSKLGRVFHLPYIVEQPGRRHGRARSSKPWKPGSTWCCPSASTRPTWITCW